MSHPAKNEKAPLHEKLGVQDIARRYPDEWVLLVDADWTDMRTTHGVVLAHSPRRAEVEAAARGLAAATFLWTGTAARR